MLCAESRAAHQGSGALAASGQNEPDSQGLQDVWPGSFWNVADSQGMHWPMLGFGATVPGAQGKHKSGLLAPLIGWYLPVPHGTQPLLVLRPTISDHVPCLHNSKTEAPAAMKAEVK